ncbi:uncharacterized protein AB675_5119 [Cyphellophora attinorum]|uniref:FAD-binding FR-type domain-containing protein n=1 Tax=Cyphellophora attinorum TaxID=1664694 RepID=A0A0N1H3E1_9EURO|nr:uncharacterized protein AB675_5119 [Phialophora attinorum]KPI39506.1 hypothetical protein AB675_5119 [Phialophora attinorum]
MAFHRALDWNEGEEEVHRLTGVGRLVGDNPTSSFLQPRAAHMAARYPLLALGTKTTNPTTGRDEIWCTVWGGKTPFAQQIAPSVLGVRTIVDTKFDPVVEALYGGKVNGEVMRADEESGGRLMAGLSINLEERGRMKLAGRVMAGACEQHTNDDSDTSFPATGAGEAQLVLKITQSLGNCPKYLNRKTITPAIPNPQLLESGALLGPQSLATIAQADLFFLASAHKNEDMDCNHRGGPPGFLRADPKPSTTANGTTATTLTWPEYSGNNLYQSLGNLYTSPECGICIPDFTTGTVLYLSGTAEILIGAKLVSSVLSHSSSRSASPSPPAVLSPKASPSAAPTSLHPSTSSKAAPPITHASVTATLTSKTPLTPTITRYRLSLSDPKIHGPWLPGQFVALDFSEELDMGYSHMRDDDPLSLNDDYIRNFTVSSVPGALGVHGEEFEVTVRKVGRVTAWMASPLQRVGQVEIGVKGFGGEFKFDFGTDEKKTVGFIAAGIGITPLLGQFGTLLDKKSGDDDAHLIDRTTTMWSLGVRDVNLLLTLLKEHPALLTHGNLHVFLSGDESTALKSDSKAREALYKVLDLANEAENSPSGLKVFRRRIAKEDLSEADKGVDEWYLCTAPAMREEVQSWLPQRAIVFENFNY